MRRLVLLFVLLAACAHTVEPPRLIEASVCDLWANPRAFVGRPVTFTTTIDSDGMHLSLLMGESCDRGLRFHFNETVPQATQDAIEKAIFQPWPGTTNKTIRARFTGTLRPDRKERRFFRYYFEITAVTDLEVTIGATLHGSQARSRTSISAFKAQRPPVERPRNVGLSALQAATWPLGHDSTICWGKGIAGSPKRASTATLEGRGEHGG